MPVVQYTTCPVLPAQQLRLTTPYTQGANVKLLQQDLNRVMGAGLTVDGVYGPATSAAVLAFQRKYVGSSTPRGRIVVDGVVGPANWCLLLNLAAGRAPATRTTSPTTTTKPSGTTYVPPSIPSQALPELVVGQKVTYQWLATNGHRPYTWYLSAGSLPPGITLSASGVMSGTPTVVGSYAATVAVKDSHNRTATRSTVMRVVAPSSPGILQELESIPARLANALHVPESDLVLATLAVAGAGVLYVVRRGGKPRARSRGGSRGS